MKRTLRARLIEERKRHRWTQQEVADRLGTIRMNVSRWEQGVTTPSPYFCAKLCELYGKSAQELNVLLKQRTEEEQSTLNTVDTFLPQPDQNLSLWTIPYPRNPHFTGRDDLLEQLNQRLSLKDQSKPTTTRQVALAQPQAIKGLGGIGKTQIAIEYAYRAKELCHYSHILWVNAASEETIMTSFVTLAELLPAFPAKSEANQHKLIIAIKHWLEQCQQRWLLIFDNVDNLSLIQKYFPQQGDGSLLLTTCIHAITAIASVIEVEQMGLMEGTQFLLHRAHRLPTTDEESNEATNVVIALDGFPLALDQAGAYIEETRCSIGDYLQIYQKHRKSLLARRGTQATNYPDSVATTWSLSFQKVRQANPAAAELLQLCAFLSPDHIPEELLKDGAPYWPPLLQQAVADLFTFNQILEALLTFSLVKRLTEDRLLSIHRLVQAVQIDAMGSEEQHCWAERVIRGVNAVFPCDPKEDVTSWPQCLRYLPQAQACDLLIQQYRLLLPEAVDVLNRTGTYLREHASYTLAEPLFLRILQVGEHLLGPAYSLVAASLNGLAILYKDQGRYEEAEPLFLRALHIWEQTLGPSHPEVARPLNNLAILYWNQGRYEEAEPLYRRAWLIREQALGPNHPKVARPLNNLAILYSYQGRYEEAEPLFLRALCIREQTLGPNHPEVAFSLNGLADHCRMQGRYEEAEPLYRRAWHIWKQTLGPNHPEVAQVIDGLADLYRMQGKYEEAEPLYRLALSICELTFNPHHPDTAETLHRFAALREAQGDLREAASLYQRAFTIREQVFSPEHSKFIETRERLHAVLIALGWTEEAAQLSLHFNHKEITENRE